MLNYRFSQFMTHFQVVGFRKLNPTYEVSGFSFRHYLAMMSLTCSLLFVFSGCDKEPKSIEFYREHSSERADLIFKYHRNPQKYQGDQDIINALKAEEIEYNRSGSSFRGDSSYYPESSASEYQRNQTQQNQTQTMGSQGIMRQNERNRQRY